jgi:argininosuccinate synthase
MSTAHTPRLVLAYSGDLTTSVAIPWLAERYHADVITVTLDVGQDAELTDVRERALAAGAVRAHVIDAREELVREFVMPALRAGALSAAGDPLAEPLARALIARRLADVARMESASAVAFGAGLERLVRDADPSLAIIELSRLRETTAAEAGDDTGVADVPPPASPSAAERVRSNVWGRSTRSAAAAGVRYSLTRAADECADEPAYLQIDFDRGVPVRANGIEMPLIELIESLDIIAGSHGVGRVLAKPGADGYGRAVEAPAAVLLDAAHRELEALVLPADLRRLKQDLAREYASLTQDGRWFSPMREAIDGFTRATENRVAGSVRLVLSKGTFEVVCATRGGATVLEPAERLVS